MTWDEAISRTFGKEAAALYSAYVDELVEAGHSRDDVEAYLNEYSAPLGAALNLLMLSRSGLTVEEFKASTDYLLGQRQAVEEILKETEPSSRILDVGCGTGLITCRLALKGHSVEGTDISSEAIRLAGRLASRLGCSAGFTLLEGELLPYGDGAFDRVLFNHSIHEMASEDRPRLLKESYRVLKGGGKLIMLDQEGVAAFDAVREELTGAGFKPVAEQLLQPVYDHGRSSRITKWVYSK